MSDMPSAALLAEQPVSTAPTQEKPKVEPKKKTISSRITERFKRKPQERVGEDHGVTHDRYKFVPDADTAVAYKEKSKTRKRVEGLDEEAHFSHEVIKGSARFLHSHLTNLLDVRDSRILDGESHRYERSLLEQLKDEKGFIDMTKVIEFVKTPRGLMITQMISDLRTELETFSNAIELTAVWNRMQQMLPNRDARTFNVENVAREFRGLRGWLRNNGFRYPDRRAALIGALEGGLLGSATSAMVTFLVQNNAEWFIDALESLTEVQVAAVVGGAVGLVGGAFFGRRFLTNNGDIDLSACEENLNVIRNLPQSERDYIKAVTGTDYADFDFVNGQLQWAIGPVYRQGRDIDTIKTNIRRRLDTRQEFYRAIGLDRPRSRTVPFNKLRPNFEHNPYTVTKFGIEIDRVYHQLIAGRTTLTREQLMGLHIEAQQKVLNEFVDDYMEIDKGLIFDSQTGEWVDLAESAAIIESGFKKNTEDISRQKEALGARRKALVGEGSTTGEDGEELVKKSGGEVSRLEKILESIKKESASQKGQTESVTVLIQKHAGDMNISAIKTEEDYLGAIQAELDDLDTQETEIEADISSRLSGIAGGTKYSAQSNAQIQKEREQRLARIDAKRSEIIERRTAFATELDALQNPTEEEQDKDKLSDNKARLYIRELRRDVLELETTGLTQDQISRMSVGELQYLINIRYEADTRAGINPPRGWPESQNQNSANIKRLINAKVESRMRDLRSQMRIARDILIGTRRIGAGHLRDWGVDRINSEMNDRYRRTKGRSGWPEGSNEQTAERIERAKQFNEGVDAFREEAIETIIREIRQEAQTLKENEDAETTDEAEARKDLIVNAIKGDAKLREKASAEFRNSDTRNKLFDPNIIPADDGSRYTTFQEREFNEGQRAPRSYYEWMELIFKYQETDDKGASFHRASQILPPEQLARILRESGRLGFLGVRNNFQSVITALSGRFQRGQVDDRDVAAVMINIVNYIRGQMVSLYA